MTIAGYFVILGVIIMAVCIVLAYRFHTKRIMQKLNQMVDKAIKGDFTEECFDESMLSALETKLAYYLAASTVSAHNLQMEKNNIKSLITDISHQTKMPVANVLLYTQLLREQELSADSHVYVDELENQAKKLQMLIDALVKTSRLETGIISLHPTRGKIEIVIQSAVLQLIPKADAKQISLVIGQTKAEAVFDPKWTEEAIFNLLDNAVKYTSYGGKVTVNVIEYELFICINVTDNGIGIEEEEQPKIFQRFYRSAEHQNEEGVGIGLYLVRQIAKEQGGYVRVRSMKGQGSTFSLYLPRE